MQKGITGIVPSRMALTAKNTDTLPGEVLTTGFSLEDSPTQMVLTLVITSQLLHLPHHDSNSCLKLHLSKEQIQSKNP